MNVPSRSRKTLMVGTAALAALAAGMFMPTRAATARDEASEKPSKNALTAASMADLHRLIRLQPGEYRWDEVPWYASIWHARKAAAEQDRPIFVFGTGGAGFNDPLGNC